MSAKKFVRTIVKSTRVARLKYWGHIVRRPHQHILRRAMNYRAPGKLKIGRPCFTWNDTLEKDIALSQIDDWEQTINDAKKHNDKCDELYQNNQEDDD